MSHDEMSFLEHLDELRVRLVRAIIGLLIGTAISYMFFHQLIEFIMWPLPESMKDMELTAFGFMQMFMIRFKLAIIGGFLLMSPFIVYQLLAFLAPAMKQNEKKYLFTILPVLILLFLGGASFGFFLILPPTIQWLISQGAGQLGFIPKADDYINFVAFMTLAFGVAFETPLVILLMIRLGIVSRQRLRQNWRHAYVASFVIAAIATPSWGIVDMAALGVALVLLFEASLFVARWMEPSPQVEAAEAGQE